MKQSLEEWLGSRQPAPPDALLARMRAEIRKLGISESDADPKALADAGTSILKTLDDVGCSERAAALDLLAADALFTYAFEAAAGSKAEVESVASYVLQKVTGK